MTGKLYGVGVGPGDPEHMTLKAVRVIKECEVIALPTRDKNQCTAYKIAKRAIGEIEDKILLELPMPMTKEKEVLEIHHYQAKEKIIQKLKEGLSVAFLTLGDPTVYSTSLYVLEKVKGAGYDTEIINGVPSFCAAAARLGTALVSGSQQLHIIPASYETEESLQLPGVKVLMKSGQNLKQVKDLLRESDCQVSMVENCGMDNEKVYTNIEAIKEDSSYYSLFIVQERNQNI